MLLNFYYENRSKFVYLILLAFLLVSQSFTSAQTGTIKGVVTDKNTKDALVGANIIVQGTNLGAAADLDGGYIIHNVSAGSQVLVVSYVGYKNTTINVNVAANQVKQVDIQLEAVALEGKVVLVTAQAKGQLQAINQQLSSNNIINVVSQEKMQELPDANIAESIGRLPGISVERNAGEADEVVVRGLSPNFNEVTIEGIPMASTNFSSITSGVNGGAQGGTVSFNQDRSIDLSLLSDNLVQSVELSKTLRPDMDPTALGGTINLTLKTAAPGLHYNLFGYGAYNNLRSDYNNYKFAGTVGDRFLDDKIGVLVQATVEEKQLPSDQFNASYAVQTAPTTASAPFYVQTTAARLTDSDLKRQRFGGSLILDYTSDLVDIKFYNIYDAKRDSTIERDFSSNFYPSSNFTNDYFIFEQKTEQRTHSLQALFKLGGTELPMSVSYTKGDQSTPNAQQFTFQETNLKSIPSSSLIYGQPSTIKNIQGVLDPKSTSTCFSNMSIDNESLNTNSYDGRIDWKVPFKLSDVFSGKLSVGAKFHSDERVSDNTNIYLYILYGDGAGNRIDLVNTFPYLHGVNPQANTTGGILAYPWVDPSYNRSSILGYPLGPSFNVSQLSAMQNYYYYTLGTKKGNYWNNGVDDYNQNYSDKENTAAGYLMGEFNVGNDLTVVVGARWEDALTDISAYHLQLNGGNQSGLAGQAPLLVDTKRENANWYPSLNIKYKATDNVQVMGAVYQSESLPNYSDISPLVTYNAYGTPKAIVTGNPLLKPATAWNLDLGASAFSNEVGLFSVNIFYKDISNLIYGMQNFFPFNQYPMIGAPSDFSTRVPGNSYYDTTWAKSNGGSNIATTIPMNDPAHAYLRGIELSWQTHLWYLPGVLSGIVLDLNASFMSSSQQYPSFKITGPKIGNKDTLLYVTTEGALQNQPNAIYNAVLGWDYKGFSARFSASYQGKTITSLDTRFGLQDAYFDNVYLLDISLKQQILNGLAVFANVTNINDHIDNYYYSHPTYVSGQTYTGGQLPTSGQTYSWVAQFGISYNY